MKTRKIVYLSIGTNQGDKIKNLQKSVDEVNTLVGEVVDISSIYRTKSWGFESDDFYNACVGILSNIEPINLIAKLLAIEKKIGRVRTHDSGYSPRLIDIDILLYDSLIINTEKLEIPHPRMLQRKFVLIPLMDIAPDFHHPIVNKSISKCLMSCDDESDVVKLKDVLVLS